MNGMQILGVVELSLIYSLVAMGVYLSFRVLQFPDLTVDGSFPLGAAVCTALILKGVHPIIATLVAFCVGGGVGAVTAFLSTGLKMLNLLAGILTMSALYSVNLRVMGNRPNLSLLNERTIFSLGGAENSARLPLLIGIVLCGVLLLMGFLRSQVGLAIRATGCNAKMARAQGVNDRKAIQIGLAISNACVALSGALFAQAFGFADVTLGVGTIIIGLASVIIGEALLSTHTVVRGVLACVLGTLAYRALISLALNLGEVGLQASDLNLMTAGMVILAMALPKLQWKSAEK